MRFIFPTEAGFYTVGNGKKDISSNDVVKINKCTLAIS